MTTSRIGCAGDPRGSLWLWFERNILDAYKFIWRNCDHANRSKIYLFGFSRGAFTVRGLAALILEQGLVQAATESEMHNGAVKAYRAYRAKGYYSIWRIEVIFRAERDYLLVPILDTILRRKPYSDITRKPIPTIEFIGVWDRLLRTVCLSMK